MNTILKKIATYVVIALLTTGTLSLIYIPQAAAQSGGGTSDGCSSTFLGFPAWYHGLIGENCEIAPPNDVGGIGNFTWIIVLNIVEIILRMAGWGSVAFIIYGGFKYLSAAGSPDGMVAARKTIMNAVIGLVLSVLAVAIVRTVTNELGVD